MKNIPIKKLILTALFAALTFITTVIIQIPIPATGGYINLGDCMVLMSGFVLGPCFGAFAAGIGSAIADLIGFPLYAPATFIIKFAVAFLAGLIFKFSKKTTIWTVICGIAGEILMVLGYYFFEAFILGLGWGIAAAGIAANVFQAIAGITASALLIQAFIGRKRNKISQDAPDEVYDEV